MAELFGKEWLLAHARDPHDGVARVFASVIDSAARGSIQPPNLGLGLTREKFVELLERYFPGAAHEAYGAATGSWGPGCAPLQASEFDDLVALLLEHRADDTEATEWLAYAVASGCMGGDHLYQDMGLPDRQALSSLLKKHFPRLHDKNSGNMKWKKFLYKQLCDRAEVNICAAPSCQVCHDYHNCFGPEDDSGLGTLASAARASATTRSEPVPGWLIDLPEEYLRETQAPQRYESFEQPDMPRTYKILGYDANGECCYYLHRYALSRVLLDDDDNFYEEESYFEEVKAWRLASGVWLSRNIRAGGVGDCRARSMEPDYSLLPSRPR
ncbi:MAG: nitrogen fixation protein NifQ [Betaproteobacteria bacterium]|nr:nitrogen fixation protein NifQ [Betaproteobacteria bacterium]